MAVLPISNNWDCNKWKQNEAEGNFLDGLEVSMAMGKIEHQKVWSVINANNPLFVGYLLSPL